MSQYKDTLNILTTSFEMKANLPTKEPTIQKEWLDKEIYQKILKKNSNGKVWTLHDGPPYANGSIHVGHSLNKILKDIIVRDKNLKGFYSNYIPGWDTHGLPIEWALIKKGENTAPDLSIAQKRDNCKKFALEQKAIQQAQFARLGLETDFKAIYMTLDHEFEVNQLGVFLKAFEKGLVYQDLKPIYWSWSSQTALADAEIEYADVKSPSIYTTFEVIENKGKIKAKDRLLIWTTTPWTIPSNLAIAVNPNFIYVRVSVGEQVFVVSKNLLPKIAEKLEWKDTKIIDEITGSELELVRYQHPLYSRQSMVILATYVSDGDGTGLVHNAPDFGNDDYLACMKYNIKPFGPIDNYGKFNKNINDDELVGVFYNDANKIITEKLTKANALLNLSFITHSVAHDWRTKKPVIYRATKQWFVNIEKIKSEILESIKDVWFPDEITRQQLTEMILKRSEWCISRQRYWGVPIPMVLDENGNAVNDIELVENIISIISKEGTNAWFEKPVEYFLTEKYKNKSLRKETDIMDVWFDSGTTWSVLKQNNLPFPAELYLEGKDQFRGWFNSSLINSVIATGKAPYKYLLGCGFVLDGQGRKMSKSIGNVIDPNKICNEFGADILRVWVASVNYREDVRISNDIIKQVGETYRKIRNTLIKFILSNISDFDYEKDKNTNFSEVDNLILDQLQKNIYDIEKAYENFNFNVVLETINNHIVELSGWYFDIIKDALYCDKKDSENRRVIQTVLFHILKTYLFALAPIVPHTVEEAYTNWQNYPNKKESFFLDDFNAKLPVEIKTPDVKKWEQFKAIKDISFAQLEKLRAEKKIAKNNQAALEIVFDNTYGFKNEELAKYLNVAKVKIADTKEKNILVNACDASLIKCERCWNYFDKNEMHDDEICERCAKVVGKV